MSRETTKWLVIGITGVTCGGKTTLAYKLLSLLKEMQVVMISQDDYFLPVEDPRHKWVPELQHIHFDVITSLDMESMYKDVMGIVQNSAKTHQATKTNSLNLVHDDDDDDGLKHFVDKGQLLRDLLVTHNLGVLIVEGFSIFDKTLPDLYHLCHLRYFFTLEQPECKRRRMLRTYEPPDCVGYFDACVWPEYVKYLQFALQNQSSIEYFRSDDGNEQLPIVKVVHDLIKIIQHGKF